MRQALTILGVIVLVFVVVGVGVALFSQNGNSDASAPDAGSSVPGASAEGLTTDSGEPITLDSLTGKPRIINVWATWCPFCVDELPDFAEVQEALGEDVTVVIVNRGEPKQTAQAFLDRIGVRGRLVAIYDQDDTFYKAIGGFAMPETLFINENDEVVLHKRGPLTREEMLENARALVEE